MEDDLNELVSSKITKKNFLKKYGHLRPGTYDILSPRYDESFDSYFGETKAKKSNTRKFSFSKSIITKIDGVLEISKLKISSSDLIKFIKDSIEGREHAKFVFTSCLSEILRLVESLGKSAEKSKEEMAHVDFRTILNLYQDLDHQFLNQIFDADIVKFKKLYEYTQAVKLPSLILEPNDVYAYYLQLEEPNFISLNKIQSKVILEDNLNSENLENNIVLIQSADPGYDYLFSKKIGGLVTQYGGANSHMAVRCAELGIPAVIGAGEQNFKLWSNSKVLEIDSVNKMVKIIS
jgi:glutamine kinase